MAENQAGMLIEETTVRDLVEQRGRVAGQRRGAYGAIAAALIAVVIFGVAIHNRQTSHPAAPTATPAQVTSVAPLPSYTQLSDGRWVVTQVRDDGTVQTDFIGVRSPEVVTQTRQQFVDNNTTNLPNAVAAETRPVVTSAQQRFLDENMAWLPAVAVPSARRECTHPAVGFPTCYTLQADGTWAREELADTGTNWIVVGTVTFDEVAAAVGNSNEIAP